MKNILLLLCCFVATGFALDCTFSDNCNAEDENMFKIDCIKESQECTCSTTPDVSTGNCDNFDETLEYNALTAAQCKTLCVGDENCVFYRWTEDNTWEKAGRHCIIMGEAQCNGADPHGCDGLDICGPDPSNCDGSQHCFSGAKEDKCDGTNTKPPKPVDNACSFVDGFAYDKSGESLHWLCGEVDAYDGVTTSVPTGTICTAHHSCSEYPDNDATPTNWKLVYECKISDDGLSGTWVSFRTADGDKYIDDVTEEVDVDGQGTMVKKLKEPACATAPLNIAADNYNQAGLLISCTDEEITVDGNDPTIFHATAPNTCLLLCDFYPILSFSPGWTPGDDTGLRTWLYTMEDGITDPDDTTNGVLNPDNIKCWE